MLSQSFRDALGITGADPVTIGVARRNIEGGGRQDDIRHTSGRTVLGLKGDVFKNWDYDVYMQTARVAYSEIYRNDFSNARILNALDAVPGPNGPVCRVAANGSDTNCVPWNIFQAGAVTDAALAYVSIPGMKKGETIQRVQGATISTDLGNYGWRMPGSKQGIGFAVGFERRVDKLVLDVDAAFDAGDLAGQGGPTHGLSGQTEVKDFFTEIRLPIMENLSVNGSYRYSDYSIDKTTDSYGLGIDWAPIKTVKLRGSYQQAVRAPNVLELFFPQGLGLFNMSNDPCAGPAPTATAVQCARSGLSAADYGRNLLSSPAQQYNLLAGGNPNLSPEKAETYTAGIVWTPTRNLSATLDYFNIEVKDVIGTLPSALVVTQCVFQGQFCDLVHRGLGGTLYSDPSGFVTATNVNIARQKTSGFDVSVNYNWNMGKYGGLGMSFLGTWTDKFVTEPIPGQGDYDCAGYYGTNCGTPMPKWRHKLRGIWSAPWSFDLAVTWRHMDKVTNDAANPSPVINDPGSDLPILHTFGARDYLDLAVTWNAMKRVTFRAGVNNLFDRDPPIGTTGAPFGNGNTYPQVYDALGRKFFVGTTVNF